MEAAKQEYIVLYQNMMYTSTTLKKMMKQTMNSKVVAILILYIANIKMMAKQWCHCWLFNLFKIKNFYVQFW